MSTDLKEMITDMDGSLATYSTKAKDKIKKYNQQFWIRMVFILLAIAVNVLVALGLIEGIDNVIDWEALASVIGLGISGGFATYEDIKLVFTSKKNIGNQF